MKEFNYVVGNDNGNSGHKIVINGKLIQAPNVYVKMSKLPNMEELKPEYIAKNVNNNLVVTITSESLNNGTATSYFVGEYARSSGKILRNIEVGAINSKIDSDVPVINTLAHIAGQAASEAFLENKDIEKVNVKVDMATGLPVTQYSKAQGLAFADRFVGKKHEVRVHFGSKKVDVIVEFEFVKVLPEGVPTVFCLKSAKLRAEELKDILKEFKEDYADVREVSFTKKRILHVSIGEGTTEYPLTNDIDFDPNYIEGTNNGTGHAIKEVLDKFKQEQHLAKFARQDFSNALMDQKDKYHDIALDIVQDALEEQAILILEKVKQEIGRANNNVDYVMVYGGGSILMKEYLKEELRKFADAVDVKVLYIPYPYAVTLEALGMYEFACSPIFKKLKEMNTK